MLPFGGHAQALSAGFTVKNVSNTNLPFSLDIFEFRPMGMTRPPGEPIPNPFSVEPAEGVIPPMSSQTFTVRFLPTEVDAFFYSIRASMPSLAREVEPLAITLRGQSFRPVCHFELIEASDYLGRRALNLRNENGQLGPIESPTVR